MNRDLLRQSSVILALTATIAVNALANILPLAGRDTGAISDMFPIPFTPAGYVFSIWGLIYLGLIAYAVYQALPAQRDNPRLRASGWLFVLSCAFNVAWLFSWHFLYISLSLVFMLGILSTLLAIYIRLGTGTSRVGRAEALFARVPFSLYLGWITVATVANVSIVLYNLGWRGASSIWSALVIVVAAYIGYLMLARRRDGVFAGVLVWAFAGIAVKHWGALPLVTNSALLAGLALLVFMLYLFLVKRPNRLSQSGI